MVCPRRDYVGLHPVSRDIAGEMRRKILVKTHTRRGFLIRLNYSLADRTARRNRNLCVAPDFVNNTMFAIVNAASREECCAVSRGREKGNIKSKCHATVREALMLFDAAGTTRLVVESD